MPAPTPGQPLADVAAALADPLLQIVAHLAKAPSYGSLDVLQTGDVTECDFPGYAPVRVQPTTDNAIDDPGYGLMDAFRAQFIAGAIADEQVVTALYITASRDGSAPVLRAISFFEPPVVVYAAGQVIEQDINVEGLTAPV